MKKNVFSLLLVCCFAFIGIAQAQEEINVNVTTDFNVTISQTRTPIALTYAPDPVEPAGILGVGGMPLYWGYMFPAAMVEPYAGKYITHVAYIDAGETQFAGTYEVNIYLGGDAAPGSIASTKSFEVTGTVGDIVYLQLDQPVVIDGTQNIWVMFYQDGSVEYPAPAMDDMGDPNSRWTGAQGMWFDLGQFASGYSWLLWAIADDETVLGETNNNMAVYPNPTTGNVTVSAPGMSHVSVMNTLGQVVYDANVSGNSLSLDLGQYQAGIYMVRVESANGVSVKRVNVVK